MNIARLNPDNLTELYYTPVYYDASSGTYKQMESASKADTQFTIYISYAHHTFVDYVVKAEDAAARRFKQHRIGGFRAIGGFHIHWIDPGFALIQRTHSDNVLA